jgi:hypothetical protein
MSTSYSFVLVRVVPVTATRSLEKNFATTIRRLLLLPVLLVAAIAPPLMSPLAYAEATVAMGAGPLSTNARLNFRVVMPRFLRFRVGAAGGVINLIAFAPTSDQVGTTAALSGTGGDLGGSAVTVGVWSNAGQITITPTNNSAGTGLRAVALADGAISYSEIVTTTSSAFIPAPTLSNAGGAATLVTPTTLPVTLRTGSWTYNYANTTVPAASIFGTSARGGRVTYTASSP